MKCPECGSAMEAKMGMYGEYHACANEECDIVMNGYGNFSNQELRDARKLAHLKFDRIWKDGSISRNEAYRWMRKAMGLSRDESHIGLLDHDQCINLVRLVDSGEWRT